MIPYHFKYDVLQPIGNRLEEDGASLTHAFFSLLNSYLGVTMKVFDRVKVLIQTEQSGPQHERVIMKLTEPAVEGLSVVSPME